LQVRVRWQIRWFATVSALFYFALSQPFEPI
jgi:hypothetical protein